MCQVCAVVRPSADDCVFALDGGYDATTMGIYTGEDPLITEAADAAANTSTAYALGIGSYFHGTLDTASDVDVIAIDVTAGVEYSLAVVGIGGLGTQLNDPRVRVLDQNGNVLLDTSNDPVESDDVVFSDDGNSFNDYLYTHLSGTLGVTGTVYVEVSGYDSGDYGLSVVEGSLPSYDIHMGAGALVRTGLSWASTAETPTTVTWAFRETQGTNTPGVPAGSQNPDSFEQFTAVQQAAFLEIIALAEGVSGLTLNQVTDGGDNFSDNADILIAAYDTQDFSGGYAWLPSNQAQFPEGGDIWINEAGGSSDTSVPIGSYSYYTLLHELGHALGLSHPALYNAGSGGSITYGNSAIWQEDTTQFTVMSYFDESFTGATALGPGYPDTFLLMDMLALQSLYGADLTYHAENTTYGYNATHANTAYDFTFNTDPFLTIWDGAGNDTIDVSGFSGAQKISLEDGTFSDVLGQTGTLSIAIGAVIENAIGGSGDDTIIGNAVGNALTGGAGADSITGSAGDDTIVGGSGEDEIDGGEDDDFLNGGSDDDTLRGGAGDDTLVGGSGADDLDGGDNSAAGADELSYSNSAAGVTVNLGTGAASGGDATGDTITGFENLFGSVHGDSLTGDTENNQINGFNGSDTLDGGEGDDTLLGGQGDDLLIAGEGADLMNGGTGSSDTSDYSGSNAAVTVQINNGGTVDGGFATGDTVVTENITGSNFDDFINGNSLGNILKGGNGDDTFNASSGNDTIFGENGDDFIIGSRGADVIDGGGNTGVGDTASYSNSDARVVVDLVAGTATGSGHGGSGDTLINIENIFGSRFNDDIYGDDGANVLSGYNGIDELFGRGGNDTLEGGGGIDSLNGGEGNDVLSGGSGFDRFIFDTAAFGQDTITDFTNNRELMDMRGSGFSFADLNISQSGGNTIISVNGSSNTITLEGITTLINADDFIF